MRPLKHYRALRSNSNASSSLVSRLGKRALAAAVLLNPVLFPLIVGADITLKLLLKSPGPTATGGLWNTLVTGEIPHRSEARYIPQRRGLDNG